MNLGSSFSLKMMENDGIRAAPDDGIRIEKMTGVGTKLSEVVEVLIANTAFADRVVRGFYYVLPAI